MTYRISDLIEKAIKSSIDLKENILQYKSIITTIEQISIEIKDAFKRDKKVFFCGNGGSAADAQHLAAEFTGKFYFDRDPLYAEALHGNSSYITAVANDYSYDEIYRRLVIAKGRNGDVLVGITTSGNSMNIINAIDYANSIGMLTIGLTGMDGGKLKDMCKYVIKVPSKDTPRIQEAHILIGHIICELVEAMLFKNK
jgi:D-sedoheptulose 7-phosphate isomerase